MLPSRPRNDPKLLCVLKTVSVHPQKLDLEIFELQKFLPGSQNRREWLPELYDMRTFRFEVPRVVHRKDLVSQSPVI